MKLAKLGELTPVPVFSLLPTSVPGEGFEERLKSEKAKKCWAQLAEERTGRGEEML